MTSAGETPSNLSPYRKMRRMLGRTMVALAPGLAAKWSGHPPPARMPRLGLFRPAPERLARQVKYMADSGAGTDACLAAGALPLPVHFYSPVPDLADLDARGVFHRRSAMGGVDLDLPAQRARLAALGRQFGHECGWLHDPGADPEAYVTSASGFSFGCAAALHMLLRQHRPQRVVEIGSGWSSRVISAALVHNAAEGSQRADYTIVDPYPGDVARSLPGVTQVLAQRVETVAAEWFDALEANDILFIDSGHTVRIGGDVNFLILDVLPRLKPGVLVHFHDIALPYEYSRSYLANPGFRMLWTESYLLQAFLAFNSAFEVVLSMNALMLDHAEAVQSALPAYDPAVHREISHSFWIRRR
jgi:Methyltransferase domain